MNLPADSTTADRTSGRTDESSDGARLHAVVLTTPVGALTVVADDRALRAVLWEHERPGRVRLGELVTVDDPAGHPVLERATVQLTEYFRGRRRRFDLQVQPTGTPFQLSAWQVLATIPFGTTLTYAEQAAALGDRAKARAVGAANGRNPLSIVVPCHRVVGAGQQLTGFAGGLDAKAWLLEHERSVLAHSQE